MKFSRPLLSLIALFAFLLPLRAAPENQVRETRLPNGLTVLTKEVHSAPVVEVMVFYRVGARNETVGQTGMSHLLEHMMFKGTKTLKPGEIDRLFDLVGARNNAFTTADMTAYHETLAAEHLELALKIEADRMINATFDPREHKREMTVVRSELEGRENSPGTLLYQAVLATAFQAHPYRWPVIGWRADVENVSRNEMYAYYKNWYAPGNAILVIVGDFDTGKALAMVRQHFGRIPARPVNRRFITPEPPQRGERRVTIHRAGTAPRTLIAYRVPRFGHPDYYALDVLSAILSGGRSARMFQSLVETGLATGADASNPDHIDPFLFLLGATAQQGKTAEDLEKALLAEVEKAQTTLPTEAEMDRAKNQIEASFTYDRDSIPDQAETLGRYAAWGDWRYPQKYLPLIRKVTAEDVQRVARRYLTPETRTVGYFVPVPAAPGSPAPAQTGVSPSVARYRRPGETWERNPGAKPRASASAASRPVKAPPRNQPPRPARAPVPPTTRVVLPNGLTVLVRENHANATIAIAGSLLSAAKPAEPPDKPGLAAFTAAMLERGTETRTSNQIAETLEAVGASVDINAGAEYVTVGGRALSKDTARLLDVLADQLRRPSFPPDQIEKLRAQSLSALAQEAEDPGARAARAFAGAVFPPGHPYHSPAVDLQRDAIRKLTRDDLVRFHAAQYAPNTMSLVIVGDVDTPAVLALVRQYFGDWASKEGLAAPAIPPTAQQKEPRRITIPIEDKSEVSVVYGYATPLTRNAPDFYAARILDWILGGGSFGSRLMESLRDKQGLVYGVFSSFDAGLGAGPFTVAFGTNPTNADRAVAEMRRQITRLQKQGVTAAELRRAKSYITGSYPIRLATNAGIAQQLLVAEIFKLGLDYPNRYGSLYRAVTREQVNEAARKYLSAEGGTLVLAGALPTSPPKETAPEKPAPGGAKTP